MAERSERSRAWAALSSLGWPILAGSALTSAFYAVLLKGPLHAPFAIRYFASHPVSFVETTMFFIGTCALMFKLFAVLGEQQSLSRVRLEESSEPEGQSAPGLLDKLGELPAKLQRTYLGRRLFDGLTFVRRKGSAQGLDDELKYLADSDAIRQQEGLSFVRMLIWATPMLGFLGTVIGITQALGDLDSQQLASDVQAAMDGLLAGLYVAFDTTALALSLSIVMMFGVFAINRMETELLTSVETLASRELVGRFDSFDTASDPQVAAIQRMSRAVIQATEQLVKRQTQLWQQSMEEAQEKWGSLVDQSSSHVATALNSAISEHGKILQQSSATMLESTSRSWNQWQDSLQSNHELLAQQQKELSEQSKLLRETLTAVGDVTTLEHSLNRNLESLSGAKSFEDMVISLSAAIQLLTTRMDRSTALPSSKDNQGRAA